MTIHWKREIDFRNELENHGIFISSHGGLRAFLALGTNILAAMPDEHVPAAKRLYAAFMESTFVLHDVAIRYHRRNMTVPPRDRKTPPSRFVYHHYVLSHKGWLRRDLPKYYERVWSVVEFVKTHLGIPWPKVEAEFFKHLSQYKTFRFKRQRFIVS